MSSKQTAAAEEVTVDAVFRCILIRTVWHLQIEKNTQQHCFALLPNSFAENSVKHHVVKLPVKGWSHAANVKQ